MAWAFVQVDTDDNSGSATTIAQAQTSNPTAGNLNVVFVRQRTLDSATSPTIADTLLNSYAEITGAKLTGLTGTFTAFYAKNLNGGSANTVTVTYPTSCAERMILVAEYSGLSVSAPLDSAVAALTINPGTGADAISSGNLTVAGANELLIGFSLDEVGSFATYVVGTGFTQRYNGHAGFNFQRLLEDKTPSSGSNAATAQVTDNGTDTYTMQAVALTTLSGGGPIVLGGSLTKGALIRGGRLIT